MSDSRIAPIDESSIPDTWDGVSSFCEWWCENGMPMIVPAGAIVYATDNAASVAVFRKGQFQVELYLIHPKTPLPEHGHPGLDVIQMRLDANEMWGFKAPVLKSGDTHSGGSGALSGDGGMMIVVFEHWLDKEPTSAAIAWSGYTVGPIHEDLIRKHYPDAFVERGYADITKPSNYRELLGKV